MPDETRVAPPERAVPLEGWERVARSWVAWRDRHQVGWGRLRTLRSLLGWLAAGYLAFLLLAVPAYRGPMRVWLCCALLLVWWFVLARSKTVPWRAVSGLFGAAALWAPLVAVATRALSGSLAAGAGAPLVATDLVATDIVGARVAVAAFGEESLKLVPLVVLALAAPGWVRRWAVSDWLVAGYSCGLGFTVVEDAARRLEVAVVKPGLFDLVLGQGPGSGYPQYGWGPLGGGSSGTTLGMGFAFAGHHVLTGLVGAGVGLGVAWWRSRSRGWWCGPALPMLAWWLVCCDHFGSNASYADAGWAHPEVGEVSTAPSSVVWTWRLTGHGFGRAWLLLALLVLAVVVDTHRVRHLRVAGSGGRATGALATCLQSLVRDVVLVAGAHARGRDADGRWEPRRAAARRGIAASVMLRRLRAAGHLALDEPGTPRRVRLGRVAARVVAALALGLIVLLTCWWTPKVAAGVGVDLTVAADGAWLAGLFDALGGWWAGLSPAGRLAVLVGLGALVGLMTGGLGSAFLVSGIAGYGLGHAHGLASLARDPRRAVRGYLSQVTPMGAVVDVLDLALTFLPAGIGVGGGRAVRLAAGDFARDPDAFVAARRALMDGDAGMVRYDALTGLKRPNTWREIVQDWRAGVAFNRAQWYRFEANEITLANRKRLDSYNPGEAIVSRKQSQLADLEPSTARRYIAEFAKKYPVGEVIKNTAKARREFPHLIGKKLNGYQFLEVPVQQLAVPEEILQYAKIRDVFIRDITGHIYSNNRRIGEVM